VLTQVLSPPPTHPEIQLEVFWVFPGPRHVPRWPSHTMDGALQEGGMMSRGAVRLAISLVITALLAASCSSGSALKHEQSRKHNKALRAEEALKGEDALREAVLKHDLALRHEEALKAQAAHALGAPSTTVVTTTGNPEYHPPLTTTTLIPTANPHTLKKGATPEPTTTRPRAPVTVTLPGTTIHRHGRHTRAHHGHHHKGAAGGAPGSPSRDL